MPIKETTEAEQQKLIIRSGSDCRATCQSWSEAFHTNSWKKTRNPELGTRNPLRVLDVQIGKGGEAESDDVVATGELPGSVQGTLQ